jgi:hypothetical protein
VTGVVVNVAVTDSAALIVTVHVPVALQPPPDQPVKLEPDAGAAVNVTFVPAAKLAEHVPGQLIPLPVTLPEPVPATATVRVCGGGGVFVNVAVTDSAALIVTVHFPVALHPPPDQPVNLEPDAGAAVNVTFVPTGRLFEQVPGQVIPPPVTVPLPVPANATVSVRVREEIGGFFAQTR